MRMNEEQWLLVSGSTGHRLLLPHSMIFIGRSDSDIILQSRSVEKHHSVISYDHHDKTFKLKDLKSANGTFLNGVRIPEQIYVQLKHLDTLRFGNDEAIFRIQRIPSPAWTSCESHFLANPHNAPASFSGIRQQLSWPLSASAPPQDFRSSEGHGECRKPLSEYPLECFGFSNRASMSVRPEQQVDTVTPCGTLHGKHANLSGDSLDSVGDKDLKVITKRHMADGNGGNVESSRGCKLNGAKEDGKTKQSVDEDGPKEELHLRVDSPTRDKNGALEAEKPYTDEEKASSAGASWPTCTAFTVEFDDVKTSNKKLDIRDSISKFAPPKSDSERLSHKRNSSMSGSRTDDIKLDRDSRNRVSAIRKGALSEGHVSASDQDDDLSAKSDPPRILTKAYDQGDLKVLGKSTKLSARSSDSPRRKRADKPGQVSDSASYLIEKMFNSNCVTHEVPKVDPLPASNLVRDAKGGSHNSLNSNVTYVVPMATGSWESSKSHTFPKSHRSVMASCGNGHQVVEEERDNCSETGTYTIDKDSPNPEEEEARGNIGKVFGLVPEEEEVVLEEGTENGCRKSTVSPERKEVIERWFKNSEASNGKVEAGETNVRCAVPLWASEWARPLSPDGPIGSVPHLSSPVDPVRPCPPPRLHSKSTKSPDDSLQSESSLENTERLLKDTENVVTAMEARMKNSQDRKKSLETKDSSGADSDLDTSAASCANDMNGKVITSPSGDRTGNSKNLGAILTAKLKKLDEELREVHQDRRVSNRASAKLQVPPKPCSASTRKSRSSDTYGLPRRESVSETASVLSDVSSSSDMSGSSPGDARRTKKGRSGSSTPTMRFNRAFSLRRARLGYDSDAGAPVKSGNRPSSAGASEVRRRGSTTSNRSDSGASVESAPTDVNQPSPNCAPVGNFARSDGGRFSLRLPRNAQPPLSKQKAPKFTPAVKPVAPPPPPVQKPKSAPSKLTLSVSGSRSTSNLCSKEAELKNWKRRKEYDPMKAAAEGRKKEIIAKKVSGSNSFLDNGESTLQRSASFHGTDDLNCSQFQDPVAEKVIHRTHPKKSLEDESTAQDQVHHSSHSEISPGSDHNHAALKGFSAHLPKHKTRLEPIDGLLISKISQLSQKLKGNAEFTLKRLKDKHVTESAFNGWLEELLANVADRDSPASPHSHTLSRELTATFKNLKKLEDCLEAIDQVVQLLSLHPVNPKNKHNGSTSSHRLHGDTHSKWNTVDADEYY